MTEDQRDPQSEEIRTYLQKEVPFQCDEGFTDFRLAGSFEHRLETGASRTKVYEITLASGRKVFAVEGALPEREL